LKHVVLLLSLSAIAGAIPVSVTYTATGGPGAWQLDFTLANNMNALGYTDQDLYFFGVYLGATDIITTPTGWSNADIPWNPSGQGGPNINFDNTWITETGLTDSIPPGGSSSSFVAGFTGVTAPSSLDWFIYTDSGTGVPYTNGDDLNGPSSNPLFAGTVELSSTTPEPNLVLLAGVGLLAIITRRKVLGKRIGSSNAA